MTQPLRIVVTGASGRMGTAINAAVRATSGLALHALTERPGNPLVGAMVDGAPVLDSFEKAIEGADAVIDFTAPEASLSHVKLCAQKKVAIVLGTTGFTPAQKAEITQAATQTPIVFAPNMSVGVNVLFRIAAEVAQVLGDDYDIEIVESHHRMKKDAPSGTALGLAEDFDSP